MEKPGGQRVNGVVELAEEGVYCVARQLEGLLELKVEEVTLVHTLKETEKAEICMNFDSYSFPPLAGADFNQHFVLLPAKNVHRTSQNTTPILPESLLLLLLLYEVALKLPVRKNNMLFIHANQRFLACLDKEQKERAENNKTYPDCRHYVNTNCEEFIKLQERVEAASHVKQAHFPHLRH